VEISYQLSVLSYQFIASVFVGKNWGKKNRLMYLWLKQNSTRQVVFAIGFKALQLLLGLTLMGFSPCLKKFMGKYKSGYRE